VSVLRKLGKTRMDGSSLQGAGAGSTASLPFVFGKNKTVLSAATQDVVDVALYASLSNVLGVSQSNGSTVLERMQLLSRATIEGRGGTRYAEELAGAEGSVRNGSRREMTVAVAPASCATRSRFIHICLHVTQAIVEVRRHVHPESCGSWPPN
jgi:hypothetical protein